MGAAARAGTRPQLRGDTISAADVYAWRPGQPGACQTASGSWRGSERSRGDQDCKTYAGGSELRGTEGRDPILSCRQGRRRRDDALAAIGSRGPHDSGRRAYVTVNGGGG